MMMRMSAVATPSVRPTRRFRRASDGLGGEIAHTHQVVDRSSEEELPVDACAAAMPGTCVA
jgi:hypothetical protein